MRYGVPSMHNGAGIMKKSGKLICIENQVCLLQARDIFIRRRFILPGKGDCLDLLGRVQFIPREEHGFEDYIACSVSVQTIIQFLWS